MAIKTYKATTNGMRNTSTLANNELTSSKPEKSLLVSISKTGGRNNSGKTTVRHHGGGAKRKYRIIDFKRNKFDIVGNVATIEYDPNRSANIALINYIDGEKRYIIAPKDLKVGDKIISGEKQDIVTGNAMLLKNIPEGTTIHNIELRPGKGAQIVRSAGGHAKIMGHEDGYTLIRLRSGEVRKVLSECMATIGTVGNEDFELVTLGKAGRKRHMGVRPTVRGSAMNPNDHPHGGGEGRTPIGRKQPVTPWGKPALGVKTRNNKLTDKFIVRRRSKKK